MDNLWIRSFFCGYPVDKTYPHIHKVIHRLSTCPQDIHISTSFPHIHKLSTSYQHHVDILLTTCGKHVIICGQLVDKFFFLCGQFSSFCGQKIQMADKTPCLKNRVQQHLSTIPVHARYPPFKRDVTRRLFFYIYNYGIYYTC